MLVKQVQLEQLQLAAAEADRALELMGRAIRMAGYTKAKGMHQQNTRTVKKEVLEIQQGTGLNRSDTLLIKHEISDGLDFDCIGNTLTADRSKNGLAHQGFFVERQAGVAKGVRVNGGSLMCQSLDRHGRLQNTTLMNGVHQLQIEEIFSSAEKASAQKLFKATIRMDLGKSTAEFSRVYASRNLH
jgi:hypothetical protein